MSEELIPIGSVEGILYSLDHLRLDHVDVIAAFRVAARLQRWIDSSFLEQSNTAASVRVFRGSVAILIGDVLVWDSEYRDGIEVPTLKSCQQSFRDALRDNYNAVFVETQQE